MKYLILYRDVFWKGTCDDGCYKLAELLGWEVCIKDILQAISKYIDQFKLVEVIIWFFILFW